METKTVLSELSQQTQSDHQHHKRIQSFDTYLDAVLNFPKHHFRNANQYTLDALRYCQAQAPAQDDTLTFFSTPKDNVAVFGHQEVIDQVIRAIDANDQEGVPQRLILLHGPNGSGKTTLIRKLMQALEAYSQTDEGAVYAFNWVFPTQQTDRPQLGLKSTSTTPAATYAHLPPAEIQSIIRFEIREPPFALIPKSQRHTLLTQLEPQVTQDCSPSRAKRCQELFLDSTLSFRNQQIFDALLKDYGGDLQKVFKHVQVERFYFNKQQLSGIVTIEPTMHCDATLRQVTLDSNYQLLPSILQSLNLFVLDGDLIYGNRGLVEFNDLLKRPLEAFKYLLGTCETGSLHLGPTNVSIDSVLLGSCNEKQLEAFKSYPDFPSFKARFLFVCTPLLLNYHDESHIYAPLVERLSQRKTFTPHCAKLLALWAVMTRLKKPLTFGIPDVFEHDTNHIDARQKAYLYAGDWDQLRLSQSGHDFLQRFQTLLISQYSHLPDYEGRVGASPREVKNVILEAYQKVRRTVTLHSIIEELIALTERTSEFEFLRLEPTGGFQAPRLFIRMICDIAIEEADRAFRSATGIFDPRQIETYIGQYVHHISHLVRGEKIRHPTTKKLESPNESLVSEFEHRLSIPDVEPFRERIINTIASAYIDRPESKPILNKLFPELFQKIHDSFYNEHKDHFLRILYHLKGQTPTHMPSKDKEIAKRVKTTLIETYGYVDEALDESLEWLVKKYQ